MERLVAESFGKRRGVMVNSGSSALKPIDQAALQTMVDTTAKELLIPGAVVLLRTPQGEFTVSYGTTVLGANSPPRADTLQTVFI